ncbi:MAG TPA: hypothetical protein VM870_07290, partial [Pyrinomonadaceae bacterium]|nr:hypothetical protein [Pyrinomonadaceae bacterium]
MANVAHHSDNFFRPLPSPAGVDAPPERVFAGKEARREGFVDDQLSTHPRVVVRVKITPARERDRQGA